MGTGRLEAFSDGVLAIIITIMVLELEAPHGASFADLAPLLPVFLSYVLSFVYLGIYWNNHHHMLQVTRHVSGGTVGQPPPPVLALVDAVRDRLDRRESFGGGADGALRLRAADGGHRHGCCNARFSSRTDTTPCWPGPSARTSKASCPRSSI